jgi:hypothetical protein
MELYLNSSHTQKQKVDERIEMGLFKHTEVKQQTQWQRYAVVVVVCVTALSVFMQFELYSLLSNGGKAQAGGSLVKKKKQAFAFKLGLDVGFGFDSKQHERAISSALLSACLFFCTVVFVVICLIVDRHLSRMTAKRVLELKQNFCIKASIDIIQGVARILVFV